ncbi:UNVERIFIED_CONTAM: hypothetical protein PYX00_010839 [Menopon gallinae]|uniref:Integrase catalytic domain-containing protein n=1 Tax=Menopon gallinae TaxID=328185 RepID=A0AAW2H746_9NEOP
MEHVRIKIEEYEKIKKGKKELDKFQNPNMSFTTLRQGHQSMKKEDARRFPWTCHNCGLKGHKKIECWKPGGGAYKGVAETSDRRNPGKQFNSRRSAQLTERRMNYTFIANRYKQLDVSKCMNVKSEWNQDIEWVLDSGASDHLIQAGTSVNNLRELSKPIQIFVAKSDTYLQSRAIGDVRVSTKLGNKYIEFNVKDCLVVNDLVHNLISVSKLEEKGFEIIFKERKCIIRKNRKVVVVGYKEGNVYKIKGKILNKESYITKAGKNEDEKEEIWHKRLGHIGKEELKKLKYMVKGLDKIMIKDNIKCEVCIKGKQTRKPFNKTRPATTRPLERVHSDLCGPITPVAYNGIKYIFTLIDDFTHFTVAFGLKNKSEVFEYLKIYEARVRAIFGYGISNFRTDNGREYVNRDVKNLFREKGIKLELTIPDTPQNNGVAERMNRTIMNKTRCRDVIFDETRFNGRKEIENVNEDEFETEDYNDNETEPEGTSEEQNTVNEIVDRDVRRSVRVRTKPKKLEDYEVYISEVKNSDEEEIEEELIIDSVPLSYKQILERDDKELWLKAMNEELQSIEENGTWELVKLPQGKVPIQNKWVFTIKEDQKGTLRGIRPD